MASTAAKTRQKREARARAARNGEKVGSRGPLQRENVARFPNGKINPKANTMDSALAVRRKLCAAIGLELSADELRSHMIGTAYGRIAMTAPKEQRREVFEAGERMVELMRAFLRTYDSRPAWSNEELPAPLGEITDEEQAERNEATRKRYRAAQRVALEADPLAMVILEQILINDRDMPAHTGDALVVLNALAHHFAFGRHKRASPVEKVHPFDSGTVDAAAETR